MKDSHDRYANIELNYLLQRIGEYAGLAILATGNRTKIDNAFPRRFDFVISIRTTKSALERIFYSLGACARTLDPR